MRCLYPAIFTIIQTLIPYSTAIILLLFFKGNKVYLRLFGSEVSLIVLNLCFYFYIAAKSNWRINTSYWKGAILFNLPLIPHYLSAYLLSSSDKIMISNICGKSETEYYSLAHLIANVGLIIWSAASASLVPFTYQKCKEGAYKDISSVAIPIIILYGSICYLTILFSPETIAILGPVKYREAI